LIIKPELDQCRLQPDNTRSTRSIAIVIAAHPPDGDGKRHVDGLGDDLSGTSDRVRLDLLPRPANPRRIRGPIRRKARHRFVADVPSDMPPPQYQSRRSRVLVRSRYLVGE
jgi:hypothetical protein